MTLCLRVFFKRLETKLEISKIKQQVFSTCFTFLARVAIIACANETARVVIGAGAIVLTWLGEDAW